MVISAQSFLFKVPRYCVAWVPLTFRINIVNYRFLLTLATLLPMIIYYLKLSFAPKIMATYFIAGIPESIFWGIAVMAWGVLMAITYVVIHQNHKARIEHSSIEKG